MHDCACGPLAGTVKLMHPLPQEARNPLLSARYSGQVLVGKRAFFPHETDFSGPQKDWGPLLSHETAF